MKTKILFIDNDVTSYFLVSELLEDYDVEILHSRCGPSAIKLFCTHIPFELVVTELKLPIIDGFGVFHELRKVNPDIPVIAQTACVLNNMKYICLKAGFNEFISKPIDIIHFTTLIKKYCNTHWLIA